LAALGAATFTAILSRLPIGLTPLGNSICPTDKEDP